MTYDKYVFFWDGVFSQWYPSDFIIDGQKYCTAEQYMMFKKAELFGDTTIAEKIMETELPNEQKALGRKVKNFDPVVWTKHDEKIVYDGSYAKFTQNADLLSELLKTDGSLLVEASPYDKIWGIGMGAVEAARTPPEQWKGLNKLGKILTTVREHIIEEDIEHA